MNIDSVRTSPRSTSDAQVEEAIADEWLFELVQDWLIEHSLWTLEILKFDRKTLHGHKSDDGASNNALCHVRQAWDLAAEFRHQVPSTVMTVGAMLQVAIVSLQEIQADGESYFSDPVLATELIQNVKKAMGFLDEGTRFNSKV
ncbi:MAG: hypothetical protein WDM86_22295 [Rhizomicrobium sp.]